MDDYALNRWRSRVMELWHEQNRVNDKADRICTAREYFEQRPCRDIFKHALSAIAMDEMESMVANAVNVTEREVDRITTIASFSTFNLQRAEVTYCFDLAEDLLSAFVKNW